MSAATTAQRKDDVESFFVTVEGFDYQVFYKAMEFDGTISHFEFYHWKDGQSVKLDCPLTETGYRSHFFKPNLMDKYDTHEQGAIAAIEDLQNLAAYRNRETQRKDAERAAAQFSLF